MSLDMQARIVVAVVVALAVLITFKFRRWALAPAVAVAVLASIYPNESVGAAGGILLVLLLWSVMSPPRRRPRGSHAGQGGDVIDADFVVKEIRDA